MRSKLATAAGLFALIGAHVFNPVAQATTIDWGFEAGLSGWTASGDAFQGQPIEGNAFRIADRIAAANEFPFPAPPGGQAWNTRFQQGYRGTAWIGTGWAMARPEPVAVTTTQVGVASSGRTGSLVSEPFTLAHDYVTFLISGKDNSTQLRVQFLVRDDAGPRVFRDGRYRVVAYTSGRNHPIMRRAWWALTAYKGRVSRLEILDNDSDAANGHINVDDFRFQNIAPSAQTIALGDALIPAVVLAPVTAQYANQPTRNGWMDWDAPLWGLVDMHTHPAVHLAFGQHVVHGAPDIGSRIPVGTRDCNSTEFFASTLYHALGHDGSTHGGWGVDNTCGDYIRELVLQLLELANGASSNHGKDKLGVPVGTGVAFTDWPRFDDITHQQMWFEWIRRARDGGLRVMVALAVNNRTLADVTFGNEPRGDWASADLQIDEIKALVARHGDFMAIAYTPADLRRIVHSGRLAVVLGLEIDALLPMLPYFLGLEAMPIVSSAMDIWHQRGVRYVFPVHLLDTETGGTAAYQDVFNASNRLERGAFWNLECAPSSAQIAYEFGIPGAALDVFEVVLTLLGDGGSTWPSLPACANGQGQRNSRGLTALGDPIVRNIMHHGFMVDIDHMSEKTANSVIAIATPLAYPLNSGHNEPRAHKWNNYLGGAPVTPNENNRTNQQLSSIAALGGLFGVGWGDSEACGYKARLHYALERMGGRQVALGTDINGLVKHPAPRFGPRAHPDGDCSPLSVAYNAQSAPGPSATLVADDSTVDAGKLKVWNYNLEGVAHYGLLPDFMEDLDRIGTHGDALYSSAEDFAQMWEKTLRASSCVPAMPWQAAPAGCP